MGAVISLREYYKPYSISTLYAFAVGSTRRRRRVQKQDRIPLRATGFNFKKQYIATWPKLKQNKKLLSSIFNTS